MQTAFLGDVLLSIPLLRKMRSLWPDHKLILICRQGVGDFFLKSELADQVFEIRKGDGDSYKKIIADINSQNIDQIFATHESLRTAFFVSRLRAIKKTGFKKPWNWFFYNDRVKKNYLLPEAIRHMSILENADVNLKIKISNYAQNGEPYVKSDLGRLSGVPGWASMSLRSFYDRNVALIDSTLARFQLARDPAHKSVALFPGSVWNTKRWTEIGFVETGRSLQQSGHLVLVMGGPGEEALCESVAKQIPGSLNICAMTTIFESALILSQAAAVVGNDSASMHLAATTETPSVVIFGPTVIEFGFRPWQDKVYLAETGPLICRPCGKHGHHVCPIGTHVCMKNVRSTEVLQKLEVILK
ncbi:MAG: glycosyltransferase family 9 protein [Bdellovibrionaceae bacterium]|nr:glycosyltransferase family 9 protein [Pseudobdellovibrionaceae bacterium]